MVVIVGGSAEIRDVQGFLAQIEDISRRHGTAIQAFDAGRIAGEKHILFAVEKAVKTFKAGKNRARTLSLEIMLYAAATRQISRALQLGVRPGRGEVAVVVLDGTGETVKEVEDLLHYRADEVIAYNQRKEAEVTRFFNITPQELEAVGRERVPELVLERVALSDILR